MKKFTEAEAAMSKAVIDMVRTMEAHLAPHGPDAMALTVGMALGHMIARITAEGGASAGAMFATTVDRVASETLDHLAAEMPANDNVTSAFRH